MSMADSVDISEVYGEAICKKLNIEDIFAAYYIISCFLTTKEINKKSFRYSVRLFAIMILAQMNKGIEYELEEGEYNIKVISYKEIKKYLGFRSMSHDNLFKVVNLLWYITYPIGRVFVFDIINILSSGGYFGDDEKIKKQLENKALKVHFRFNEKVI